MKALVLLHGALGCAAQFEPLVEALRGKMRCYVPEFPGHGRTPVSSAFNVAFFSEWLSEYRGSVPEREIVLFGYSMGGYVALKAASSLPGLKGIVSLGTKFDWDESSAEKERALLDAEALQASAPEFMALLRERHVLRDVKELFADTGELMQRLGNGEDRLREEEIAAVSCPVFISRGAKDRMVSEAESRGMASRYLRGSYVEVPETPHAWEKVNTNLIQELIARSFSLD